MGASGGMQIRLPDFLVDATITKDMMICISASVKFVPGTMIPVQLVI